MGQIGLIIFYGLFISLFILKSNFFKTEGVSRAFLVSVFLLKAFFALLYGYLFRNKIIEGFDTFEYFDASFIMLRNNPLALIQPTFGFMTRINAFFQLFSFGYYNVHAIFISFVSFIGVFHIFQFFKNEINEKINSIKLVVFLTPSFLFWPSGLHKEAVVTCALGLILWSIQKLEFEKPKIIHVLVLICSIVSLTMVRYYVIILFFPAIVAYLLSKKLKPIFAFFSVYFICFATVFTLQTIFPQINFFNDLIVRQNYFITLKGNTTFPMDPLVPTWSDLIQNLPWAFINPFIRPLPFECKEILCIFSSIEAWIVLSFFLIFILYLDIKKLIDSRAILFCLFFGVSIMVIIGLLVNNSGAIVRYRSFVLPFLILGFLFGSRKPWIISKFPWLNKLLD